MNRKAKTKGSVLSVRTGSNPNSSSLGVDVTWLLGGGVLVGLLTMVGQTLTRWALTRAKSKHGQMD